MRLGIGKTLSTRDWSNNDFNAKYLSLILSGTEKPSEVKIYLANKELMLEKKLFPGLPFLHYKEDPKFKGSIFKLMPVIAIDRRYAFYFVEADRPELLVAVDTLNQRME